MSHHVAVITFPYGRFGPAHVSCQLDDGTECMNCDTDTEDGAKRVAQWWEDQA